MPGRLRHERLVQHQGGSLEPGVEVPVLPGIAGLAHRQHAVGRRAELVSRPLDGLHCLSDVGVALQARVRPRRAQALQRIDHEGQGLDLQADPLDGIGGGQFVDGRDRQDGLTFVHRLVGQRDFGAEHDRILVSLQLRRRDRGKIGGPEDGLDARHRERVACVDRKHAAVRPRAEQQLAEEHALGAEVLRVTGPASHLRNQVRRAVVPSEQGIVGHRRCLRAAV